MNNLNSFKSSTILILKLWTIFIYVYLFHNFKPDEIWAKFLKKFQNGVRRWWKVVCRTSELARGHKLFFKNSYLLTAGEFDLSLLEVGVPARLFWLLVTLSEAELVMVICCWGRLNPSLGEQGAEADWGCRDKRK